MNKIKDQEASWECCKCKAENHFHPIKGIGVCTECGQKHNLTMGLICYESRLRVE